MSRIENRIRLTTWSIGFVIIVLLIQGMRANAAEPVKTPPSRTHLMHRYACDEMGGTQLTDSVGQVNGMNWFAGWSREGCFGGCAMLSDEKASLTFPAGEMPPTQCGSVVFWMKTTATIPDGHVFFRSHFGDGEYTMMRLECYGAIYLFSVPGGAEKHPFFAQPATEQWHQYILTWDAEEQWVRVYLDGKIVAKDTFTPGKFTAKGWSLGESVSGAYDSIAVYDVALTPEEVVTLFTTSKDGMSLDKLRKAIP